MRGQMFRRQYTYSPLQAGKALHSCYQSTSTILLFLRSQMLPVILKFTTLMEKAKMQGKQPL